MGLGDNFKKPAGFIGKMIVAGMNSGHAHVAEWGFSHLDGKITGSGLDIGCGGGANVKRLLERGCSKATGIDYSDVCVAQSTKFNKKYIERGSCRIVQASVSSLPFEDGSFDIATAFETVYFWPEIEKAFKEVFRVLKKGGLFFICNEVDGLHKGDEKWTERIGGMKIYTGEQLSDLLAGAGFTDIQTDSLFKKKYLCVSACT